MGDRLAQCSCGAVSVRVDGPPAFSAICCCRDCQKRSGSAFGMSVYFDAERVTERNGTPTVYRRVSNKGRWLDFRFCPTCGTSVWWEAEFLPGKVGVSGALFDDAERFVADGAYFCATKPDWVTFPDSIRQAAGATTSASAT